MDQVYQDDIGDYCRDLKSIIVSLKETGAT